MNDFVELTPGSTGFSGGTRTAYDMDNSPSETFRIDGGAEQTFDGTSVYNATITYIGGTTASITAVVFQDTDGNTYLAPEYSNNADMIALEAAPIRSLSLDSLYGNSWSGMTGSRQEWDFVTCFVAGARIRTPAGEVEVETLDVGDLVCTRDRGACPIRWIGSKKCKDVDRFRPVRIRAGALGIGSPAREVEVSQQHRIALSSAIAERIFGQRDVLIAAKRLVGFDGVSLAPSRGLVTYLHIMFDRHEIVFANGLAVESLLSGPMARQILGAAQSEEIEALFPGLLNRTSRPALPLADGRRAKRLVARLKKNNKPLLSA